MREHWHELTTAWRRGLTPGLTWGWLVVVVALTGLRCLGERPGWTPSQVLGILGTLVIIAGQLATLSLTFSHPERPVTWARVWQLVWDFKGTWLGLEMALTVLMVPWGLFGLSSQLVARVWLPSRWVNLVGLHRRPVVITVAIIYLLVTTFCLIRGPRDFRRLTPGLRHPGRAGQMIRGIIVSLGLLGLWFGGSQLMVAGVKRLGFGTENLVRLATAAGIMLSWIGFQCVAILGVTTLIWCWCGAPSLPMIRRDRRHWIGVTIVAVALASGVSWQTMMARPAFANSAVISHRGVDHEQGVQNTLGALRRIHRERPTFVEMDLHETRDGRWVVLHDETLATLAKRQVTPRQLTLRQLQRLEITENGQHAHLASWSDYLRLAERFHQPLLVEIKTTSADSANMVQRFGRLYGQRLRRDGSRVHSLDYRVVATLRRQVPKLAVGYITPFNWVNPQSMPADFYSLQQISVSRQFILAAKQRGGAAYVWTPDSRAAMTRSWELGADGQITNNLRQLRQVTDQAPWRASWAILQNFIYSYI
ncbi:glycerophosphodiester phosphodiesterase [Levilactobacillus tangyuanensis]|uniref:Glycerophosphodiester phosphodiesterase n=1 Tax=Levilactobacillus tangyuanensis TaxID=2486021 RepID=A0ABW1TMW4_9LACO|nr:glycerophosphodiester phosphodiesterase [Levilactobacillus tangyuanensis]